ncbi:MULTISPECIES: hypothetical protein [Actinomadura]|uniref:Uncharacterized protein n=1 Tax=Actinomadura litoris TaxID=2678616 RepID=A0A7K1L0Z0_9ACTN|nr:MULTISPECIES: hypothetical protein [Actinomadura]MBT2206925.1 hypothetical protein [Actinomadura sp. NEAU-AAG7]MUN37973.1 hypothetical protein [Actinomadura litoris]
MAHQGDGDLRRYAVIGERLGEEFEGVHADETVARCVSAARYGAEEVTGAAPPELVERIARRHLEVLATVAAEKRRRARRSSLDNAP